MNRNLLYIGGGIGVLLLIIVTVYFVFFQNNGASLEVATPGSLFGTSENATVYENPGLLGDAQVPTVREVAPRLTQISAVPVAKGVHVRAYDVDVLFGTATSTVPGRISETKIRYVERATGNMYSYSISPKTLTRVSNQTLPGVVDVAWSLDGTYAFARYLTQETGDTIQTYALAEDSNKSYFLEEGLDQVLVTPEGLVLTLLPSSAGSIATLANPDGTGVRTLFSSNLSSIRLATAGDDYVAYTKASAGSSGYVFKVDGGTGSFERLAGPHTGLTALPSPSGKTVLLGYRSGNSLRLELFDVATRISTALPIATLPEKCAWSSDETELYCGVPRALAGTLPDSWYQGGVSLSDRFWKIDVENRLASLMFDPQQLAEVNIDTISPVADSVSRSLIFTNKSDGSLWLYEL